MLTRRSLLTTVVALIPASMIPRPLDTRSRTAKLMFKDGHHACCRIDADGKAHYVADRQCDLDQVFIYENGELVDAKWLDQHRLFTGDTYTLDTEIL